MDREERLPTTPRMGHLSDEQQARMTQNLSAAKAILARKQTESPASPVEALMHGKPVSPANRNRAAQPSNRASSFKRKLESSAFADGPLRDLAVNTSRELPRKEKHGGRIGPPAHRGYVLSSCAENLSDGRPLSTSTLNGGTQVVRQSIEAWGSTSQVTGSLLQQGATQSHYAALEVPGHTSESSAFALDAHSKPVSTSVGRSVGSQVHLDQLRKTAVGEFEPTSSRPQQETFTKPSKQFTYIGDDLDDALLEEIGKICDAKEKISREVTGNHRETLPLWQEFDDDSLREIDRCVEREKKVVPSVAAKQLASPVGYESIQALQRGSSSRESMGLSPQTSHMSRHSVVLDGDAAPGPESFLRSSKTVEAFEHPDVLAAGVETAPDMEKSIHDGIHETDAEAAIFPQELLDFFEYGISPASPTATERTLYIMPQ